MRLGSLSKSLTPGLRVGWINARRDLRGAARRQRHGRKRRLREPVATVVAGVLSDEGYGTHVEELRASQRARQDTLTAALHEHLPAGCRFDEPRGGFFVWLTLPAGLTANALLPFAEERGVSFAPGVLLLRRRRPAPAPSLQPVRAPGAGGGGAAPG